MSYHPDKHHRRSIRLDGYDYSSSGAYFITICTHQRQCLFGNIIDGTMQLNDIGHIVANEWMRSQTIRQEIQFDEWIIMPNHIHGIVLIQSPDTSDNPVGALAKPCLIRLYGHSPTYRDASQPKKGDRTSHPFVPPGSENLRHPDRANGHLPLSHHAS